MLLARRTISPYVNQTSGVSRTVDNDWEVRQEKPHGHDNEPAPRQSVSPHPPRNACRSTKSVRDTAVRECRSLASSSRHATRIEYTDDARVEKSSATFMHSAMNLVRHADSGGSGPRLTQSVPGETLPVLGRGKTASCA